MMQDSATTAAIGDDFVPRRSPAVELVELDGDTVLYAPSANTMHVLNIPATIVWSSLDGTLTIAQLAADLSAAFGADPATVRRDVLDAIRGFASDGLLDGFEGSAHDEEADLVPPSSVVSATPRVLGPPPDG